MKKVKLDAVMTTLKGETIKDVRGEVKMNEFVAEILVSSKATPGVVRTMNIAQNLWLKGDCELEDSDWELVRKTVENCGASTLVVAQILKALGVKE